MRHFEELRLHLADAPTIELSQLRKVSGPTLVYVIEPMYDFLEAASPCGISIHEGDRANYQQGPAQLLATYRAFRPRIECCHQNGRNNEGAGIASKRDKTLRLECAAQVAGQ